MYTQPVMDYKTVSIAPNRQMTIPKKFYETLGFTGEAMCYVQDNTIVIKPRKENPSGEFDEYILKDLIDHGYSGHELLEKFKETRSKIPAAMTKLIEECKKEIQNQDGKAVFKEIFGDEAQW